MGSKKLLHIVYVKKETKSQYNEWIYYFSFFSFQMLKMLSMEFCFCSVTNPSQPQDLCIQLMVALFAVDEVLFSFWILALTEFFSQKCSSYHSKKIMENYGATEKNTITDFSKKYYELKQIFWFACFVNYL